MSITGAAVRDERPTMTAVDVPGVKTNPPLRVMATVGLDNIDVDEVVDMCLMSNGRFDYRIKFHFCLLTRDELMHMIKTMRYTIIKEYRIPIEMVDEVKIGKKPAVPVKRYLLLLQNEWIDYINLMEYYPKAKALLEQAHRRWASEPGPIVPVKVSYSNHTFISWYPY